MNMIDFKLNLNQFQNLDPKNVPLPFGARDDDDNPSTQPENPVAAKTIRRSPPCWVWGGGNSDSRLIAKNQSFGENSANLHQHYANAISCSLNIHTHLSAKNTANADLHAHLAAQNGESAWVVNDVRSSTSADAHLQVNVLVNNGLSVLQIGCADVPYSDDVRLSGSLNGRNRGKSVVSDIVIKNRGKSVSGSLKHRYGHSMQPPCHWREIPLDEVLPVINYPCGKRPHPAHLPLEFYQFATETDSAHIPLSFACRTENFIPNLKTYIMVNEIIAQANGRILTPFSASISASVDGYCWLGEVSLSPDDFAALTLEKYSQGNELEVELTFNGETFVFLAEQYSDNRQFGRKSYTVSGRSPTAHCGADYAQMQSGMVSQGLYAQQIAAAVLYDTGFGVGDWTAVDWLIPENTYTLTDKTPIAVLQELAQAAGAFVETDPRERKIHVRPRWKKAAWALTNQQNNLTADVRCPAEIILKINGQKEVKTQYNSVFVYPSHEKNDAALVYRSGSDKMPQAPMLTSPLYTQANVQRAAGLAALSESGIHKMETVEIAPPSEKYAIPRAKLGQIWRFDEPDGAWFGVVVGVKLSASVENGAPKITQTLTVDRYLGD